MTIIGICNGTRAHSAHRGTAGRPGTRVPFTAMSMFALNGRLRGASMGHLAVFEATSSVPCRRIASGLARLGFPDAVATYFEEHIEADAVHEQLAARDICGNLEPELHRDVLFGAQVCMYLDSLLAEDLLARWDLAVAS